MAPPLSALYTLSFFLALLITLLVACTLRLLAILPGTTSPKQRIVTRSPTLHARPSRARILVVLGSGGHTHEMFALLRDLDTSKYVHRTYVVSSGDNFSAQRAVAFEARLEERARNAAAAAKKEEGGGTTTNAGVPRIAVNGGMEKSHETAVHRDKGYHVGPEHYTIATIPRARRVHQPLYTTPFSALKTLLSAFRPLLSTPPSPSSSSSSSSSLPHLILTNGPATAVIIILAVLILRFLNIRGAQSRGLCRTIYVESFARVETLSLSGKLLVKVVDRFLVQWESLEGYGGRAEYGGILV